MTPFQIAGQHFELDRLSVETAAATELPEPIQEHYVVVAGRRYPPKQVLALATGLDRADFTTHHARRVLKRLGFVAARADDTQSEARAGAAGAPGPQAQALAPFVGQWVALAGPTDVLVAAETPQEVLAWLARHDRRASYGMFRVPAHESEAEGAAPV